MDVEHPGAYQVIVQESFAGGLVCTSAPVTVVISTTESDKLFIFPSPNDGRFTVSYYNSGGTAEKRTIVIYDSKGAMIYQQAVTVSGAYNLLPVDLHRSARGIYYLQVRDASGNVIATGKVHVR